VVRNPYEAFVYALKVDGLPSGVYHYSAIDNTLGLLNSSPHCSATELLVGQYWAEQANAIILLVANFERTMWKYPNPTAYRVLLIEAGHIAQNMCLAASDHHLTTTPTAAICDTHAHELLGLDLDQAVDRFGVAGWKSTPRRNGGRELHRSWAVMPAPE
jgi:SagB-type dehydrogenase family enzyme